MSWSSLQARLAEEVGEECLKAVTEHMRQAGGKRGGVGSRGSHRRPADGAIRVFLTTRAPAKVVVPKEAPLEDHPSALPESGSSSRRHSRMGSGTDLDGRRASPAPLGMEPGGRLAMARNSMLLKTLGKVGSASLDTLPDVGGANSSVPGSRKISRAYTRESLTGATLLDPASAAALGAVVPEASRQPHQRGRRPPGSRLAAVLKSPLKERLRRLEDGQQQKAGHDILRRKFLALPPDEAQGIAAAFEQIDVDACGVLDQGRVLACLKELGLRGDATLEKNEVVRVVKDCIASMARSQGRPPPRRRANFGGDSGEFFADEAIVDLLSFAVIVVPKVRHLLGELQGGELLRHFLHFDKDGSGKLQPEVCVEVARCLGIEQNLLRKYFRDHQITGSVSFEHLQLIVADVRAEVQRLLREHERHVKEEMRVSEEVFQEFRDDIVVLYEMFLKYDEDKSRHVSPRHVLSIMREFGVLAGRPMERREVERLIADVSGEEPDIGFEQLLALIRAVREYQSAKVFDDRKRCFDRHDRDRNGKLSGSEVANLLSDVGCIPRSKKEQEELGHLIRLADADGDDNITYDEFQNLSQRIEEKLRSMRYEQEVEYAVKLGFEERFINDLLDMFDAIDTDGSQKLDVYEVRAALASLGKTISDDSFSSIFGMLDADGSGALDFKEFLDFMRLLRDGETIFGDDASKLNREVRFLDTKLLRLTLVHFRVSKAYLLSLPRQELITLFCTYFRVSPNDNVMEKLQVSTFAELCELAEKRDEAQAQRAQLSKAKESRAVAAADSPGEPSR